MKGNIWTLIVALLIMVVMMGVCLSAGKVTLETQQKVHNKIILAHGVR